MDIDKTVNRIVRDMKMSGLISEDYTEDVKFFVRMAYVAGYEERKKDYNQSQEKEVIQEDRHHKKIHSFDSMAEAYKKIGMSKTGMINAIRDKILTRKGYYFKYAETNGDDQHQ